MKTEASDNRWLHDLRNAINTATLATGVAQRLLAQGDTVRAAAFLTDVNEACQRSCALLDRTPTDLQRDGGDTP